MKLNIKQSAWAQRYHAALKKHLDRNDKSILTPAYELGRKAVPLKLETLDVIRVHRRALLAMDLHKQPSIIRRRMMAQSKHFFAETIVPIEKTHRVALLNDVRIKQLAKILHRRTIESTASSKQLQKSIVHRQAAEAALKKSRLHLARILQRSDMLKKRLRTKTHTSLAKHEETRKKAGLRLQDEIIQALVAIKFRMEALKNTARNDMEKLRKEIAETQLLVKQSVKAIRRLAQEVGA